LSNGYTTKVAVCRNVFVLLDANGALWSAARDDLNALEKKGSFSRLNIYGAKARTIAAGSSHMLALDENGALWTRGRNATGQLGFGDNSARENFETNGVITIGARSIAAGNLHSVALDDNGALWVAGNNCNGALGLDDLNDRNVFTKVNNADLYKNGIRAISAGFWHTVLLDNNGNIWTTGSNECGELANGDATHTVRRRFARVTHCGLGGNVATAISAGGLHTVAIDNAGRLWVAGSNINGELGLGDNINRNIFVMIDPATFNGLPIVSVTSGFASTAALDTSGAVWIAGLNNSGCTNNGAVAISNVFAQVDTSALDGVPIETVYTTYGYLFAQDKNGCFWINRDDKFIKIALAP
jgi:alpha-tubulin suppressor-like RCC1 family protein